MKNLHPAVKFVIMFVIGVIVMIAAQWFAAFVKHKPFTFDWLYIIGMGVLIAVLDLMFPSEKRKENRENLKKRFKK